jgi:hypothetical protein
MQTIKHDTDLSDVVEKEKSSSVTRITAVHFDIRNPDVTYHYVSKKSSCFCYLKGGTAELHDVAIDKDITKDTSEFIYSRYGAVRPVSFIFQQDGRLYDVKSPLIDFTSTANSVTLKEVVIKHLADIDKKTGREMEIYNLTFPSIECDDFNWKKLMDNKLLLSKMIAAHPVIEILYNRQYFPSENDKMGKYPNQLIHEFIKTDIKTLLVNNCTIKYTEPSTKDGNATFQFDNIHGTFKNITNIDSLIAVNKSCIVTLEGKFQNKSPVGITFDLSLSDPKGHFTAKGYVNNLDGDDVSKQAAGFTFAKVTSFHLSHMSLYIEGNESYAKGDFTMLYENLKISLFKFKSDERKSKKGPFSFIAETTLLYPNNPMPGQDVRKTSTDFTRDPNKGFISLIWKSMYSGAQKTAVRNEKLIVLAGGKTDNKKEGKPKKKGFLRTLFGKKKK